jgi:O-antigen/teichoic acid export membrane protein
MISVGDTAPTPFNALVKRSLSLGGANAFDYALQFLLPLLLVRSLSPEAFGQYRLLWLAVMTVMVVLPLGMPQSLYFFLPRADADTRRRHVRLTLVYLALVGVLCGLIIAPWNPLLPTGMRSLAEFGALVPVIALIFALSSMLDILPTIEERIRWQIGATISLSILRTVLLGGAAFFTGELQAVLILLLGFLLLKLLVLLIYIGRSHGLAGRWFDRAAFITQFRHASPLGASSALYSLRAQGDQWVAAALFSLNAFAAFSIAAVLGPLINLFRHSVNHVFLPSMSRLQAAGDLAGMVHLNNQANVMVGRLVYPMLALAFVYAEELVTLIYTDAYVSAAPVMRVYILGLLPFVIDVSSLMLLLREGRFAFGLNSGLLVLSLSASGLGAFLFGLPGAAIGSTLAIYVDRLVSLRRLSRTTALSFRCMQDWPALCHALALAMLGGLSAHLATTLLGAAGDLGRVLIGGAVLGVIYGGFTWFHRVSLVMAARS